MIIIVLGVIGTYFCFKYNFFSLLSFIWMSTETRGGTIIQSLRSGGYPDDKCITVNKMRFLFAYRDDVEGGYNIPKEIVQMNIFGFYNLIVSGIIIFCVRGKFDGGLSLLYVDIAILSGVAILLRLKAVQVALKSKFKKMNRYNLKYVLSGSDRDMELKIIGECKVVAVRRKGSRKYVKIEMLSTGEKLEDVLFCGRLYKGKIYMLNEICHLKYVDHIPPKKVRKPIENCKIIGGKTIRQKNKFLVKLAKYI